MVADHAASVGRAGTGNPRSPYEAHRVRHRMPAAPVRRPLGESNERNGAKGPARTPVIHHSRQGGFLPTSSMIRMYMQVKGA